ncbi:MAG: tetratricopeptide repeat protein [Pseudomonadota bacterium]
MTGLRRAAFWILVVLVGTAASPGEAQTPPGFVGSATCGTCHNDAYRAWSQSHHAWALKPAAPDTVLGDFDDAAFEHGPVRARFSRDGDRFVVTMTEADGSVADHVVRYAVGVAPLQQYLVEAEGGRLQALDVAWDTERRRWYALYPDDRSRPGDGFHWTGPYKNWQARCATCHQTGFEKAYDPRDRTYASRWQETTIGCEACHGAGSAHVAWARDPGGFDAAAFADVSSRGLSVVFPKAAGRQEAEFNTCAGCHSRREALDADSVPPGSPYHDHYAIALLRDDLYHHDGQIDEEVYVAGSFLQSKMHARGVTCGDCHDPHSAELKAAGNAVCTQCHNPDGRPDFPTLKPAAYDTPAHHHHVAGTPGAQCVSCHMPEKAYMVVDPRRDHSFRVPRPDLTVSIGTPNACNACHADRDAAWAAAAVKAWYPSGRAGMPHFAETFYRARLFPSPQTAAALAAIADDEDNAAIVRATAVAELRNRVSPEMAQSLLPLLADAEPLVRLHAVRALERAPAGLRGRYIAPLIADPVRGVRLAAVRATLDIATVGLTPEENALVREARRDFQVSLRSRFDFPETHLQLAGLALSQRNDRAADAAFSEALRLDPQRIEGWIERAGIALRARRPAAAETVLTNGLTANPRSVPLLQNLAALYLDTARLDTALETLRKARDLEPFDPGLRVDIARLHYSTGDTEAAVRELNDFRSRGGSSPAVLELLAAAHIRRGALETARRIASELRQAYPAHDPEIDAVRALLGLR